MFHITGDHPTPHSLRISRHVSSPAGSHIPSSRDNQNSLKMFLITRNWHPLPPRRRVLKITPNLFFPFAAGKEIWFQRAYSFSGFSFCISSGMDPDLRDSWEADGGFDPAIGGGCGVRSRDCEGIRLCGCEGMRRIKMRLWIWDNDYSDADNDYDDS